MTPDPIAFCLERVPVLFAELKANAEARAAAGDKRVQTRLADNKAASATLRVVFTGEGGGEVFVATEGGELRVTREKPEKPLLRNALSLPLSAAQAGLALFSPDHMARAAERDPLPGAASARADKLFTLYKYAFDVSLSAIPTLGDVVFRIALGKDLPSAPEFTVRAAYPDLADARSRGASMQELMASGKLVITGDMAKAMMFGMTLAQLR